MIDVGSVDKVFSRKSRDRRLDKSQMYGGIWGKELFRSERDLRFGEFSM